MDSMPHEKSDTLSSINDKDDVPQSLNYMNQQINHHVNKSSNYRNQASGKTNTSATLQQTGLTNSNYKESKV